MVIKSCPLLVKDTETCVGSSLASYFVLFSLISFYFVFISLISFRFVSFLLISFRFVSFSLILFRFVSFLFRFALYRYPLKLRQAEYFFFIGILTSVLTIQSSISQFEFLFEQLSTIKLFQCFHIQMVVVPFLRNNPSAVMFFQRFIFPAKTLWEKYFERIWVFHCR